MHVSAFLLLVSFSFFYWRRKQMMHSHLKSNSESLYWNVWLEFLLPGVRRCSFWIRKKQQQKTSAIHGDTLTSGNQHFYFSHHVNFFSCIGWLATQTNPHHFQGCICCYKLYLIFFFLSFFKVYNSKISKVTKQVNISLSADNFLLSIVVFICSSWYQSWTELVILIVSQHLQYTPKNGIWLLGQLVLVLDWTCKLCITAFTV